MQLTEQVKVELMEWVESLSTLKLWIQLRVPRVEDGNNFGVAVQEEAIGAIGHNEDSAFAVLEGISKFYMTRASLLEKLQRNCCPLICFL